MNKAGEYGDIYSTNLDSIITIRLFHNTSSV